ncbi:MAG: copper resistance protein CopC [Gemmatimonadota bacterium]
MGRVDQGSNGIPSEDRDIMAGTTPKSRRWVVGFGVVALLCSLGANAPDIAGPTAPVVRHITLDASLPEDDAVIEGEVTEVRLFFSDAPLMRGASIRIVNSSRQLMRSRPPRADEEDPKQLSVQVAQPLPAGTYVVQWRCIADDGHVMRGDFTFEVAAS